MDTPALEAIIKIDSDTPRISPISIELYKEADNDPEIWGKTVYGSLLDIYLRSPNNPLGFEDTRMNRVVSATYIAIDLGDRFRLLFLPKDRINHSDGYTIVKQEWVQSRAILEVAKEESRKFGRAKFQIGELSIIPDGETFRFHLVEDTPTKSNGTKSRKRSLRDVLGIPEIYHPLIIMRLIELFPSSRLDEKEIEIRTERLYRLLYQVIEGEEFVSELTYSEFFSEIITNRSFSKSENTLLYLNVYQNLANKFMSKDIGVFSETYNQVEKICDSSGIQLKLFIQMLSHMLAIADGSESVDALWHEIMQNIKYHDPQFELDLPDFLAVNSAGFRGSAKMTSEDQLVLYKRLLDLIESNRPEKQSRELSSNPILLFFGKVPYGRVAHYSILVVYQNKIDLKTQLGEYIEAIHAHNLGFPPKLLQIVKVVRDRNGEYYISPLGHLVSEIQSGTTEMLPTTLEATIFSLPNFFNYLSKLTQSSK